MATLSRISNRTDLGVIGAIAMDIKCMDGNGVEYTTKQLCCGGGEDQLWESWQTEDLPHQVSLLFFMINKILICCFSRSECYWLAVGCDFH